MSTITNPFEKAKVDVAEKVRKLLAQAEDRAATAEEAQTFTMKAQELMSKYSIDLAMVSDAAKADELIAKGLVVQGPYASHKVGLLNAVARTNDCRAIYTSLPRGWKHVEVVGYPSDVEWVEILTRSLEIQLASALAASMRKKPGHVHGRTYAVGFVEGFIAEVNKRLHQARKDAVSVAESVRPADGSGGRSVALVLVAKARRVDDEFRVRHPRTRTVYSQVRLRSWDGYEPGRAAGSRATLARGSIGDARRSLGA
jgi:hypothetical protein